MIHRIDSLSDFGIYRSFQWGSLPLFAKRNLIYGWNYSGKTTLSRLFQILEKPERMTNWGVAGFRMTLADGSFVIPSALQQAPKTRVFNRDYINENFDREHTAPAVFILGAENVAIRQRLEALSRRHDHVIRIRTDLQSQGERAERAINDLGTDSARNVGELLGDRNFRRPNLMRRVEEVRGGHAAHLLDHSQITAKYEMCRSTNTWVGLTALQSNLPDLEALFTQVTTTLSETSSNRAIARLKANRNLESWVRTGLDLHRDNKPCEFCGSPISEQRLDELKGHFSQEYEALVREVVELKQESEGLNLSIILPDSRDWAPDLKGIFTALKEQVESWTMWAEAIRTNMLSALSQKQTAIESPMTLEVDLTRASEGSHLIGQINGLIQRHNVIVSEHDQVKNAAKLALERHHAALLFQNNDLLAMETQVIARRTRVAEAEQTRQRIRDQISHLELRVRQQSIGAAKLNEILNFLLTGSNIVTEAIGDGLFEFRRDGVLATNLSDGEKTAITFAYFLTSLEANGAVLSDTIVFVDDPISSLDSNHIYAVYSLISKRLQTCRQVFLSTHNAELFNLMKDGWFGSRQRYANGIDANAYYVRRLLDGNNRWSGVLEDLPDLLRRYKSEYHFVFAQLHTFMNSGTSSLHEAYTAPNLIRKLLEAYLGFKKPSIAKWSDKLDLLFDSEIEQLEIQKFADDASHLQNLTRALQQPDFVSSAQRCVGMVLGGLRAKDIDHYSSLCAVIGVTP